MKWFGLLLALGLAAYWSDCTPAAAKAGKAVRSVDAAGGFSGVGSYDDWKSSVPEFKAGMECMKKQRWDEATAHFKASLTLYSFQPKAWIEIGRANEEHGGNIADSEQAYREALKIDSSNWHAWKRLANVLLIQKQYKAAREAVASALGLNPPQQAQAELDKMIQAIEAGNKSPEDY